MNRQTIPFLLFFFFPFLLILTDLWGQKTLPKAQLLPASFLFVCTSGPTWHTGGRCHHLLNREDKRKSNTGKDVSFAHEGKDLVSSQWTTKIIDYFIQIERNTINKKKIPWTVSGSNYFNFRLCIILKITRNIFHKTCFNGCERMSHNIC